jgi:hypothetical protein
MTKSFDYEKGCFNQVRLTDYSSSWDFELAIDACRNLMKYDEWVVAVFYKDKWHEILRDMDFGVVESRYNAVYTKMVENKKDIKNYLTNELKIVL